MPADHKVSVGWQIVATFVPIVNLWAFYKIRKLRKYLVYVFAPSTAITIALITYSYGVGFGDGTFTIDYAYPSLLLVWVLLAARGGFQGFSIYLVIIWSQQHNRNFDAAAVQT